MSDRSPAPCLIAADGTRQVLKRIPLDSPPFLEDKLQELLRLHPELLPVGLLDERFVPLICIGRETDLGKGCYLDNLYISPGGYLTLVETKLWKNPEARREVVGQIIEYAKQLSQWSFADVDRACRAYTRKSEGSERSLVQWLALKSGEPVDEADLVDTVNRTLRDGHVKLLIVGEGIRESVVEMTEFLQRTPYLRFGLALVEMACYSADGSSAPPLTIIPRLIARTVEVERAVVTVRVAEDQKSPLQLQVSAPASTPAQVASGGGRRSNLDEEEFYRQLAAGTSNDVADAARRWVASLTDELGVVVELKTASMMLKLRDPNDPDQLRAVFAISKNGDLQGQGRVSKYLEDRGLSTEPAANLFTALEKIHPGLKFKPVESGGHNFPAVPLADICTRLNEITRALQVFTEDLHAAGLKRA